MSIVIELLLWVGAIGAGMMAGLYFGFSAFIMASFAALPAGEGARAMQSINRVILRSPFMVLFFATTLVALALAVIGVWQWGAPGATAMLVGGVVYVAGMFVSTAAFNVPLNNALDRADPDSAAGADTWAHYLVVWTRWNHSRTVASALAGGLFTLALVQIA